MVSDKVTAAGIGKANVSLSVDTKLVRNAVFEN
jgi:hypothetical protein